MMRMTETPASQLKKIDSGIYHIITDGVVIGRVEEEVDGWAARRSFPTAEECKAFMATGQRFEFMRKTRRAAVRAFFQSATKQENRS